MQSSKIDGLSKDLPDRESIFCLRDSGGRALFIGASRNLKNEIKELFTTRNSAGKLFSEDVDSIEILDQIGNNPVEVFSRAMRRLRPIYNISLEGEIFYPYFKITREPFPRLYVTRVVNDEESEYFGAFLPSTGVRFWLEFLNKTFRLRTCQIQIDGKFPAPCTQFFFNRCVAPCVESLCDRDGYLEMVQMTRLFLRNEREELLGSLTGKIERAAENLEFEKAAEWRNVLQTIQGIFGEKNLQLWLDDAVDTFELTRRGGKDLLFLVTQRGRKTLGKKVLAFENPRDLEKKSLLSDSLWQFYEFHAPREIRVPFDFPSRKLLQKVLSERERREVKITIIKKQGERKTSLRALRRARFDFEFEQIKPQILYGEISRELKEIFNLAQPPKKIEAFDAAHLSGSNFTAAKTVWEEGEFVAGENEFWLSDEAGELETLRKAAGERFALNKTTTPDLLLVDGGKAQLQAVLNALKFIKNRSFVVVAAVKPPLRHAEVSHFITEKGDRIEYAAGSEAMRVLLRLRDEAHELANLIHRQRRDTSHFYQLSQMLPSINEADRRFLLQKLGSLGEVGKATAAELENYLDARKINIVLNDLKAFRLRPPEDVKPLIVPIRYDDPNGEARDLQPLVYRKKRGSRG